MRRTWRGALYGPPAAAGLDHEALSKPGSPGVGLQQGEVTGAAWLPMPTLGTGMHAKFVALLVQPLHAQAFPPD